MEEWNKQIICCSVPLVPGVPSVPPVPRPGSGTRVRKAYFPLNNMTYHFFDVMDTYFPACQNWTLVCRNIINEEICRR